MPSPFPGMDPWLEAPGRWGSVHHSLISLIYTELNGNLPEGFAAIAAEYVYLLTPQDRIVPDVAVTRRSNFVSAPNRASGGVLTIASPVEISMTPFEEYTVPYLQVVTTGDEQKIISIIEILSPVNKTGSGREQYLKKQRDILDSSAHLLEIDLLRAGQHTVAVDETALLGGHRMHWDYLICLHRAGAGERFSCWPFTVREPLPAVYVPLTEEFPDFVLDLSALFHACYDAGPFRRTVDYSQPPVPRLGRADGVWAQELTV
jgi:Protein of unknown function (DUF4058)